MAQDNDPSGPTAREALYLEKKLKIDGTWHEYRCTAAYNEPGMVVVRFPMRGGSLIPGTSIYVPPDSTSFGFFWKTRPYNLYRMVDREGVAFAHRFDAVTDVQIEAREVSYRDLVLDWWVLPDDTLIEEDRDEYDAFAADGTLSGPDQESVRQASQAVFSRYRHIIDRAAELLVRKGIGP